MSTQRENPIHANIHSERALEQAIKFYELDHQLSKPQREILANAYNSITYTSTGLGWAGFVGAGAASFLFQRAQIQKRPPQPIIPDKPIVRPNLGVSIMFAIAGMLLVSPFGSRYAYNSQLEQVKSRDHTCAQIMGMFGPGESMKWWMYYKLTAEKPEFILKDPRSEEVKKTVAEREGKSAIFSNGRDPMGLYSGPRHELNKIDQEKQRGGVRESDRLETANGSDDQYVDDDIDDDPFESKERKEEYASAWDRIRSQNGSSSSAQPSSSTSGSAWNKVRRGDITLSPSQTTSVSESSSSESFEEILEKERHAGEEEGNRW